jgi:hypothetical protein
MENVTEKPFAPKCIFCSAPWSDDNVELEIEISQGCPTCGAAAEGYVSITYHVCKREMYRKEATGY